MNYELKKCTINLATKDVCAAPTTLTTFPTLDILVGCILPGFPRALPVSRLPAPARTNLGLSTLLGGFQAQWNQLGHPQFHMAEESSALAYALDMNLGVPSQNVHIM